MFIKTPGGPESGTLGNSDGRIGLFLLSVRICVSKENISCFFGLELARDFVLEDFIQSERFDDMQYPF